MMRYCVIIFLHFGLSCRQETPPLFEKIDPTHSGVHFENNLIYTEQLNPYTYKNFFNGGGVGIGDINNDGLSDIFFCGNMVSNKLYLNKGGMHFVDITSSALLETKGVWSSGVSMVDINADGLLDIYVCKSGPPGGGRRHNELFINNGDLTFSEESEKYGLANEGLSSHAAFFDYDQDGDLDCYLLNNSLKSVGGYDFIRDQRNVPDTLGGNKLFRNDDGHFTDVTINAGIYSSDIGFGLGVTIGDFNEDNWADIYVSNDFFERDYLYINQRDGTFRENIEKFISEMSMGSMGADFGDINNDGHSEIFVTEMLPKRHDRLMSKALFENWDKHQLLMNRGYYNQFGRNVLQLNNGDQTFSEIGRFAGVDATDWSWGALIFDMDNDGGKDLFVANGIYKDLLDLDYVNFMSKPGAIQNIIKNEKDAIKTMIDMMPSEPLNNYAYQNNKDLTFSDKTVEWGFSTPTFSSGSAYGDLDNDGDLDLVINNVNMKSFLYENKTSELLQNNYLKLILIGEGQNINAIGSKIKLHAGGQIFYQELNPFRGFESTVDNQLVFGLGGNTTVDKIEIIWPDERVTVAENISTNQVLIYDIGQSLKVSDTTHMAKSWYNPFETKDLDFTHKESAYVDFDKDRLLFHMNSTEGPCICKGDVNNDGIEDMYIGGASGQSGILFVQKGAGTFDKVLEPFETFKESEDLSCTFFDANGDGILDLYVASGSSEFSSASSGLMDPLYFGDGTGQFHATKQLLPHRGLESSSVVLSIDYDADGDLDLFVGGRQRPYYYGLPVDSHILENDGNGSFTNVTKEIAPELVKVGMVTDAVATDLNLNGAPELVLVGKWMSPKVFEFNNGKWKDETQKYGLAENSGLYNEIASADLNGDGYKDLIFGNYGTNTRFRTSREEPLGLLVNDFDNNGTLDLITTMYFDHVEYPFIQLKDLVMQLPVLKKKYLKFNEYKNASSQDVFGNRVDKGGYRHHAKKLESFVWLNDIKADYQQIDLPSEAQFFPIYAIHIDDFNSDGNFDLLLGGNFLKAKPEIGSNMAGHVTMLIGQGDGSFEFVRNTKTGINIKGEIRAIESIQIENKKALIFGMNNQRIKIYRQNEHN